jgi:tetratricopeptide (TPR) repeat protein
MRDRKKGKIRKDQKSPDSSLSLSVIIPVAHEFNQLSLFLDSLSRIRKPYEKDYEVVILAPDVTKTSDIVRNYPDFNILIEKKIIRILPIKSDFFNTDAFKTGLQSTTKKNILIFELHTLERAFNFEEIFNINQELVDRSKVLYPVFREQNILEGDRSPIILMDREFAEYYSTLDMNAQIGFPTALLYVLHKMNIPYREITISQVCPLSKPDVTREGFISRIRNRLRLFLEWFITIPLKEIRSKPEKLYDFIKIPSLFRLMFLATAVVMAMAMPLLSRQAGFSGDEDKHYNQAEKVYNYYVTRGEDKSALSDPEFKLNYYGQSFDLFTYTFNKIFKVDKTYETNHIFISLAGFLTILFSSSLASLLMGYRAGVITMILMFFAPRFLGHSFNNPLDIPFALGYVFTIYQVFRFLKKLPHFSIPIAVWITLGIAWTISIRIGGLLLIPYTFFFAGLYVIFHKWEFKLFSREGYLFIRKGLIFLVIISLSGYFLSLLPWPYGLQRPVKNPFEALKLMSNISVAIRVLFNGNIIWSNKLPWYYISMNILYTVPVIILLGFILNPAVYRIYQKHFQTIFMFFLYFSVIFPLAYVVYKNSNVYGGWRHLLFVFPPMAVISGITFDSIARFLKSKYLKYALTLIFLAGLAHPIRHIIVNHPFEYIYFNELIGNVKKAFGRFENDYYLNSLRQGSEWLIQNVVEKESKEREDKIIVATNASIGYYFRHYQDQVQTTYTRYYDRGAYDWDYAVYFCNYINSYQLKNNIWPPYKTIHTIDVDHVPICAVVKRESKMDYQGIRMINRQDYLNGIPLLEEVIKKEPYNEIAMLKLTEAYIQTMQYDNAVSTIDQCLEIYPDYDKALNLKGITYMQKEDYDQAMSIFIHIVNKVNYRFVTAYHNLALISIRKQDVETAKNYLRKAIEVNSNYQPAYLLMAEILKQQGLTNEANQYLQVANSLN